MSKPGQRVLSTLRQMIISRELAPGERVTEIPTAERLGISRTPLRILEQEGLLEKQARRGYRVRLITPNANLRYAEVFACRCGQNQGTRLIQGAREA
ncbi:GntR family transcriptional regulator [Pseudomaricurvus hydrocarbonicus]|uniref:GntR family transcriptional regulator n=1 Tax=Pseudomaricurvus hydrocarbonicus TaxID=1470433 RepID=UPI001AA0A1A8|nr:GntR family transcriptional regulator [Aestuariicella hydrocarbonica]